jgi:hypothetical protein
VFAAAAVIGVATLTPSSEGATPPWCAACALRNQGAAANLVVNLFLFMPLGLGLRLAGLRAALVLCIALALSVSVEALQAYVIPGRVASVVDIAANTMGAVVAAIGAPRWRTVLLPNAETAARLALVSLVGLIAVVAASAWALTPATPHAPLVVRGVGARGRPAQTARVLAAAVDGRAIDSRDTVRMPGPHALPILVELALQVPRSGARGEPALRLVADGQRFLRLGIEHDELALELRRKGEDVRLLAPSVRLPLPLHRAESATLKKLDTLVLRAVAAPWWMSVAVEAGAVRRELPIRLHPLAGWSLLASTPQSLWLGELLTALWTGMLFLPIAYWSAAVARRRGRLAISAVLSLSVTAVWAIGAAVGARSPPWSAVVALIAAVLAAWRLERRIQTITARSNR